jgi:CheY-like chemotaxis protein
VPKHWLAVRATAQGAAKSLVSDSDGRSLVAEKKWRCRQARSLGTIGSSGWLDVDLAILDITMPILDGASTLPHLRRLRSGLDVILATGKVDEAMIALTRSYREVTLLPKRLGLARSA